MKKIATIKSVKLSHSKPKLVAPTGEFKNADQLAFFRARLNAIEAGLPEYLMRRSEILKSHTTELDPTGGTMGEEARQFR
jgi:hypothetical protein